MSLAVVLFQIVAYTSSVAILGWSAVISIRAQQVHRILLLSLSVLSIVWLEGPYDWAIYVQFHPDFPRIPGWGPFGATWQGFPAMMPAGYLMYYMLLAAVASGIASLLVRRRGWRHPQALLVSGLTLGFVWHVIFTAIATYAGLWRFGRAAPGLVVFPGTYHQFPLYDGLAIAITIMVLTYLMGSTNNLVERWASRRALTPVQRALFTLVGYVVVIHIVYLSVFAPQLITKLAHLDTTVAPENLFPGVPNQPF